MKKAKVRQLVAELLEEVRSLHKPAPAATGDVTPGSLFLIEAGNHVIGIRVKVAGQSIAFHTAYARGLLPGTYPVQVELEVVRQS